MSVDKRPAYNVHQHFLVILAFQDDLFLSNMGPAHEGEVVSLGSTRIQAAEARENNVNDARGGCGNMLNYCC